jgi:hypothetical protein
METVAIQFDLFKETTDVDLVKAELAALKESHHAVRRKLFAQNSALTKMILDQQNELDFIKVKMGLSCFVERK